MSVASFCILGAVPGRSAPRFCSMDGQQRCGNAQNVLRYGHFPAVASAESRMRLTDLQQALQQPGSTTLVGAMGQSEIGWQLSEGGPNRQSEVRQRKGTCNGELLETENSNPGAWFTSLLVLFTSIGTRVELWSACYHWDRWCGTSAGPR